MAVAPSGGDGSGRDRDWTAQKELWAWLQAEHGYELIGVDEVAKLLMVQPVVVRQWWWTNRIHPPVAPGPPPKWDRYEIEAWAEEHGLWPG